ncbi:metal ABC transporter ATP-binding protein [Eubacterium oxidoreducens]|uniref:Zinc transport system ATP-binding protein n=1 Tax=Eubacterium oxidoreducens TaxID=1732 RepID=A0A1G6CIZ0_EUBOX|nr:metal ABC transporter ATP-binding protein [Eubacterium oxidoreducens]SDB32826.1 zinc transport system ATP-binding protein [Eubacterium oxidoreducens]
MSYITAKNLSIGYEDGVVTKDLNFTINPGEYLCVVGENGTGKSTLMKTLLKLIKPLKGSLIYDSRMEEGEIGYLPQQSLVQKDFPASVWEIVLSGNMTHFSHHFFYGKEQRKNALDNMKRLEIEDLKKKSYAHLSGGQKQRVLLARALCASSKILVLDEPVTGLDPKVTQELYNLLAKLNREGLTIVMVSHDVDMALSYATHILHVGKTQLYFGPAKDYKKSKAARIFLKSKEKE